MRLSSHYRWDERSVKENGLDDSLDGPEFDEIQHNL